MHIATLANGLIGYIGNPITTVKPSHYRIIDLNLLIHSVVHTYHPETTESINFQSQDMIQINKSFKVNHIDL